MEKPGDEAPAMESTADKTQNDSGFQEHFAQETSDKFVEAPEDTDKELRVQTSSEMTPGLAADERVPEEENATPSSLAPAAPFRMKNKRRASSRMSASTTPSSSTSVPRASRLLGPSVEDPHEIRMEELSVLENGASTESPLASASVKVSVPVSRDASKNGSIHSSSGKPTRSSIWASPVTQPQSLSPHGSMETLKQNGASAPRKQSAFPTLFFSRGRGETLPAPKEEVDPESELVLSRLNETVALDEGASQNNTTSWLSTQLQSAYQSLRETVVGDLMESDDAVDWGTYSLNYLELLKLIQYV